jgi:uncharacterized protein YdiU (UPF0061 family)
MDSYHPATVYSSIDAQGRYAYANQPRIAHWNLSRLAGALLTLLGETEAAAIASAREALDLFPPAFEAAYVGGLRRKLGLFEARDGDVALAQDLLARMAENAADFTLTFRRLADSAAAGPEADGPVRRLFANPAAFDIWAAAWRARLAEEGGPAAARAAAMRAVNPAFIPRNHRVEAAIRAAEDHADFTVLDQLLTVLAVPFDDQPDFVAFEAPPRPEEVVHQTFCGT